MLSAIKAFFDQYLLPESVPDQDSVDSRLKVATVALLLETARADFNVQEQELQAVAMHAQQFFELEHIETQQLVELAEQEIVNATSYYGFTSLINSEFSTNDKIRIVELMWQIAYADEELEKYEEALIRKIADLLYVPHNAFISAKLRVKASLGLE